MEIVMRFFRVLMISVFLTPVTSFADLTYNAAHDEALKNLQPIESASINAHYQCGQWALTISAYATQSDVNGRRASITSKIASGKDTHDISEKLTKAISRHDILTGQMSVACNPDKGVFKIDFTPNAYAAEDANRTMVSIFWDGTVNSFRVENSAFQPD